MGRIIPFIFIIILKKTPEALASGVFISQIYYSTNHIFKENKNVQICAIWQGQKDLNPRHAVLEAMEKAQKRDK